MTEIQYYWRCEHHPSAIDNFFAGRAECGWCCHTQELRWSHGGVHPEPANLIEALVDSLFA